MPKDKGISKRTIKRPVENHETAAWANAESVKRESGVNIPSELEVRNAKEYVDSNQK